MTPSRLPSIRYRINCTRYVVSYIDGWFVVGNVVSLRHSTATTPPAAAMPQLVYETAHPLLVLPPGVVALTLLRRADHQIIGSVVWCVRAVCGVGLWPNNAVTAGMSKGFHRRPCTWTEKSSSRTWTVLVPGIIRKTSTGIRSSWCTA